VKKPRGAGEQETKEMDTKWQENGSMDPYVVFHPYLSSAASGNPLGVRALCPHHVLVLPRR
jgi:hypothetical protein